MGLSTNVSVMRQPQFQSTLREIPRVRKVEIIAFQTDPAEFQQVSEPDVGFVFLQTPRRNVFSIQIVPSSDKLRTNTNSLTSRLQGLMGAALAT